jgi:hypothetical protein
MLLFVSSPSVFEGIEPHAFSASGLTSDNTFVRAIFRAG